MSKQFFTQEDFRLLMITSGYVEQVAADIANEKTKELQAELEKALKFIARQVLKECGE